MSETSKLQNLKAKEIFESLRNLACIKNFDKHQIIELFKSAIIKTIQTDYDEEADLEFIFDEINNNFSVLNKNKRIVPDPITDEEKDMFQACVEVTLSEAQKNDPNLKEGDIIAEEIDFEKFSKKDYIKIGQMFNQSMRELEKQQIYEKYSALVGQIIKAKVITAETNGIILELEDMVAAFMPPSITNKHMLKRIQPGDTIDVYVDHVLAESKHAQVIVSSVDTRILNNLLIKEIPEISQGLIEIVGISRISGERSKICIKKSEDAPVGIEELGSIIGINGERIENISRQLKGEKIDVILYSENIKEFIINALSPAKVIDIIEKEVDPRSKYPSFLVIVPNTQHTLAIGRRGQNVTLASELTKSKLDIISQKEANEQGIDYGFNGNISLEEIHELENGKRLQSNFKKKKPQTKLTGGFDVHIDMSEFEDEIAELRSKVVNSDAFEKQILGDTYYDNNFEETLEQVKNELDNDEYEEEDEPYSFEEDYEKITSTKLKDFKQDDDLSFGLDDLDLSNINDEDW
ncbi:transcription termination factor NusA [[Mycoplasma] anseris]|uniref:Transcription termination/antitermination protein NusA n=1 Tax=[Mycoplasma] anseris TaxID=92400 RepID=A0A2Z4ND01_9BACT|nr:transcription termination factor NusA [[Mycoplasma] anseris]AWX69454.1 transcription termination factor NusA [[Mycoplasma] anseris]